MSIYNQVYNTFIELLGNPSSSENLDAYISFVLANETKKNESENYCEDHHIIPNCILKNEITITLEYTDHVQAHLLLARAYPISMFLRPLNYMLNSEDKKKSDYRKLHSESIKSWWRDFRKSENYDKWRDSNKRRNHLISEANLRHINEVMVPASLQAMSDPIKGPKRIEAIKKWWTNDRKEKKSIDMIEYNKINGTQRYTDALNKRWSEMDHKTKEKFSHKMKIVNNDEFKKESARTKMKAKWNSDEVYKDKMAKRPSRTRESIERTARINSELWKNQDFKENQLKKRKAAAIRKKSPDHLKEFIFDMSDDELIEKYGHLSRKAYTKTPNNQLKDRVEVFIIKAFKKARLEAIDAMVDEPETKRGWYRKSSKELTKIIKTFVAKYGILKEYEIEIGEVIK